MNYEQFLARVQVQILMPIVTLLTLAAFVMFVWGLVQFIYALQGGSVMSDGKAHANTGISAGKKHMVWGIVGLVIMFGANAIIAIIKQTVGVE